VTVTVTDDRRVWTSRTTPRTGARNSREHSTFHNHSRLRMEQKPCPGFNTQTLRVTAISFSNSQTPSFVTYRPQSIQMVKAAAKKSPAKAVFTTKAPPKKIAKAKSHHNKMEAPLFVSLCERVDFPMPSVGVFCGCRPGAHEEYTVAAVALGTELARRNLTLVYGGGTVGLMGSVKSKFTSQNQTSLLTLGLHFGADFTLCLIERRQRERFHTKFFDGSRAFRGNGWRN
jgi:hypothetical protein